ncbi:HXXXD-type acyl-transferase family protein [Perilla frutescens var. hirtella]|nr:HXXXD-type acyl-transferase family protein [Perilla frutescens var. hirtella]
MESTQSLSFNVARKNPELIAPAKPTPYEFKNLSDIDDQDGFRHQLSGIQFYRRNPSIEGKDPVEVIRDAIAKALVFYYPFAGRLRERAARKLVVECTGEGVMFIEADADVTLQQFGDDIRPPFPFEEELLYDVPHTAALLHCPLLLIQVTRLKCGGFIFAFRLNHSMSDGAGIIQFMSAVGELARGADVPSVPPVWDRHLLNARNPPCVTCTHHAYHGVPDSKGTELIPPDDMVQRTFFFGSGEFSALRSHLPLHLRGCSIFDLLTASLWHCRTVAISPEPNEVVKLLFTVNCRKLLNPPLPDGYYGNAIALQIAISTAGDLSKNPLHYAVELVKKMKTNVTEEFVKSTADMMVIRGRPHYTVVGCFIVSDLKNVGFNEVDFGWGNPVYGGPMKLGLPSFYISHKNNKGENGILVSIGLTENAMKVFAFELERMLKGGGDAVADRESMPFITSAL